MSESATMTRQALLELHVALDALRREMPTGEPRAVDHRFNYALAKTRRLIADEVEAIQEAIAPLPAFVEYERARVALCEQYAEKDHVGRPATDTRSGQTVFRMAPETKDEFDRAIEDLRAQHQEAIAAEEERVRTLVADKFMQEQIAVPIHRVTDPSCVPALPPAIYDAIFPLLDEEAPQ